MVVLTKKNISVTLTGSPTVTTLDDGNFLVHVGTGTQDVTAYSPAESGSGATLRNGASYNLPGNVDNTPFDGRYNYISTHALTLPKTCIAGDSICIGKSATDPSARTRNSYWAIEGRSHLDEMLNIQFVSYAQAANQMRPYGLGSSPAIRTLRDTQILSSSLNVAGLPSVVVLAGLTNVPAWAYFEGLLSDFCGEVMDGWGTDRITPDLQHPGYGSYMASLVSQALVMLCSTANTATKTPLARRVTQWGMDLWGAWLDGRLNRAEGGHSAGRKALIMAAGKLLGNASMMNPDSTLGAPTRFMENDAFREFIPDDPQGLPQQWWFDSPVWDRKYVYKWNAGTQGEHLRTFPSIDDDWQYVDFFGFNGYMPHVTGAQVGNVLAMRLMGLESEYGADISAFIDQWMATPGATNIAVLNTSQASVQNIPWGEDYSVVDGADMCAEAYTNHNP